MTVMDVVRAFRLAGMADLKVRTTSNSPTSNSPPPTSPAPISRLVATAAFTWLGAWLSVCGAAAADHLGRVTFSGLPVPGAAVSAARGDDRRVTSCDQDGVYHFADLADGRWTLRVEMRGFTPLSREIEIGAA